MADRRSRDEFVRARSPIMDVVISSLARCKVTARYTVEIAPDQHVACVRVRCGQRVMHFSAERFSKLFEAIEKS